MSDFFHCKCFHTIMHQICMFFYGYYKLLGLCSVAGITDLSGAQCCVCVYVKHTKPFSVFSYTSKMSLFYCKSSPGSSCLPLHCNVLQHKATLRWLNNVVNVVSVILSLSVCYLSDELKKQLESRRMQMAAQGRWLFSLMAERYLNTSVMKGIGIWIKSQ